MTVEREVPGAVVEYAVCAALSTRSFLALGALCRRMGVREGESAVGVLRALERLIRAGRVVLVPGAGYRKATKKSQTENFSVDDPTKSR